jgi:hypothetical protein
MAANNTNCKYVELIREIRVTNIHASFAANSTEAVDKFFEVLNGFGYTANDISVIRASQYTDSAGDQLIKIYTCCTRLEDNDHLIGRLRRNVFNGKAWDAYASSKCLVLAASTDMEKQKRMVDEMVRIHRAHATTINDELKKMDALEDQIQRAKLTLNLRLNSSTTKANELDKNGFN